MKAQSIHCPGTVIAGRRGHRKQGTDHSCLFLSYILGQGDLAPELLLLRGAGFSRAWISGFCREQSRMGHTVPVVGAREAVVWVYLAQVHTTYLETNSHFLSGRLLWVNKQDC